MEAHTFDFKSTLTAFHLCVQYEGSNKSWVIYKDQMKNQKGVT